MSIPRRVNCTNESVLKDRLEKLEIYDDNKIQRINISVTIAAIPNLDKPNEAYATNIEIDYYEEDNDIYARVSCKGVGSIDIHVEEIINKVIKNY